MAATSRHGLFSLFSGDKPLLSCHDLNIVYCVNPEESVGRASFKQIMVSLLYFLSGILFQRIFGYVNFRLEHVNS